MATRDYDSVSFPEDSAKTGKMKCMLDGYKPKQAGHSSSCNYTGRTLTVTSQKDGKAYGVQISDIDIDPAVKLTESKNCIEVKVIKTGSFSLQQKASI